MTSQTGITGPDSDPEPSSAKATPVKRRRRRRDRSKFKPNFDIPGVHKLVLGEECQRSIGCVVGDAVTAEKAWLSLDKDVFLEDIEMREQSEFLPLREQIANFLGTELLLGYIPDESKDYDEFYLCVTTAAIRTVNEIVDKLRRIQEESLQNAIHKKVKRWKSLGSEREVDETKMAPGRSLLEVEIESKYPILPFKVHFKKVKCQEMRDGYMELRGSDESANIIVRKRVDLAIQVAPSIVPNQAQTVCTYPRNSSTQYEYETPDMVMKPSMVKLFEAYMEKNIETFCEVLRVNGCIDLYLNDYEHLVLNPKFNVKMSIPETKEYLCFMDMNLSGSKMISSLAWHPFWTGIIIAAYVDIAPPLYLEKRIVTDEVHKAIHDPNPVLFWSFTDDLKPKLILETPRPVYALSCCPYDENVIVGGCVNGQIIIWDITNKLIRVEEEEILTVDQQRYRAYMNSLMYWMKNIVDLTLVRPTAVSDLKYSHTSCVNAMAWGSPFHNITKTGKMQKLPEDAGHTLQLFTSSEDGTVMIWDLLKKPVTGPGGFKSSRKLRRLKKKPSALLVEESPFKQLHLNLRPIYKVVVAHQLDNRRTLRVSSFFANFFTTKYELINKENIKNVKLSERLMFRSILDEYNSCPRQTFWVGTMEGDFIQGSWEGHEFDSGEVINWEEIEFVNYGRYHDGPVVHLDYAPAHGTILSVGGKVFALWREDFLNKPVLWRKGQSIYTYGTWFLYDPSSIKLVRMDGYIEMWSLYYKSKSALDLRLSSNGAVTQATTLPRKMRHNVFGLADYRGSLRLFCMAHPSPIVMQAKLENMSNFLTAEIQRKKNFLAWQEEWNERHAAKVVVKIVEEERPILATEEEGEKKKKGKKEEKVVKVSAGQRYLETVREQHKINEQARIKSIILKKKQLDREVLLREREPLRKLEEENEMKRRKQRNKVKESDHIFRETVAMLFPDVVKEKPVPPPDPYQDCNDGETKMVEFETFRELAVDAQNYVYENPFDYDFSWSNVLRMGKEKRRKTYDVGLTGGHRKRYLDERTGNVSATSVENVPVKVEKKESESRASMSME